MSSRAFKPRPATLRNQNVVCKSTHPGRCPPVCCQHARAAVRPLCPGNSSTPTHSARPAALRSLCICNARAPHKPGNDAITVQLSKIRSGKQLLEFLDPNPPTTTKHFCQAWKKTATMFDRHVLSDVQTAALLPLLLAPLPDHLPLMSASQTASLYHAIATLQLQPSGSLAACLRSHVQQRFALQGVGANGRHMFSRNQLRSLHHSNMVLDLLHAARVQGAWSTQGVGDADWHRIVAEPLVRS